MIPDESGKFVFWTTLSYLPSGLSQYVLDFSALFSPNFKYPIPTLVAAGFYDLPDSSSNPL